MTPPEADALHELPGRWVVRAGGPASVGGMGSGPGLAFLYATAR